MRVLLCVISLLLTNIAHSATTEVRLKELARVQDVRDYALVGYGLVVGLAGSGDSDKNRLTRQSLVNTLKNFKVNVTDSDINSKNTAAVMITSSFRSFSEAGDKLDVEVSALGDARSLLGGTLLMAPLYGADEKLYALSQGPISVGGYIFDANGNSAQKNHPTVGRIPHGATVERSVFSNKETLPNTIALVLNDPDFTTAQRIADSINSRLGIKGTQAIHAGKVEVPVPSNIISLPAFIARIENITVSPDQVARIVVNERTGTIVAGGHVRVSEVNISQGDLNVTISTKFQVSQPVLINRPTASIGSVVVPDTQLTATEKARTPIQVRDGTTVGDLVQALYRIHLSTRDVITVLQAIKQAGALHAELVIQ